MSDMQQEALLMGAASVRVSGKAICCDCPSEVFEVIINNDGTHFISCANPSCRTVWSPLGQGQGEISRFSEAVAEGGYEQGNLVSEAKGKERMIQGEGSELESGDGSMVLD